MFVIYIHAKKNSPTIKSPEGGVRYTFLVFLMFTLNRVINVKSPFSFPSFFVTKSFLLTWKQREKKAVYCFIFSSVFHRVELKFFSLLELSFPKLSSFCDRLKLHKIWSNLKTLRNMITNSVPCFISTKYFSLMTQLKNPSTQFFTIQWTSCHIMLDILDSIMFFSSLSRHWPRI